MMEIIKSVVIINILRARIQITGNQTAKVSCIIPKRDCGNICVDPQHHQPYIKQHFDAVYKNWPVIVFVDLSIEVNLPYADKGALFRKKIEGNSLQLMYIDDIPANFSKVYMASSISGIPSWLNLDQGPHLVGGEELTVLWNFFHSFGAFEDNSLEIIVISHTLYCLPRSEYHTLLSDAHRALKSGGTLRIQEDNYDMDNICPCVQALSVTGPHDLESLLNRLGFSLVTFQNLTTTLNTDPSILRPGLNHIVDFTRSSLLNQRVFIIEAIKQMEIECLIVTPSRLVYVTITIVIY